MSAYDYTGIAATATRLIERYGRSVTLRARSASGDAYNPSFTNTDTIVKGVITNFRTRDIDGTLIQAGDTKIYIDSATAPTKSGQIIDGSDTYSIIDFTTIKPGATTVLYIVQGRK